MAYTEEKIRKMEPALIAKASPVHIENVIKDLIAYALAAPAVANAAEDAVAEAIFKVIKPTNMIDKDWNSGAILGFENGFRDQVKEAARAAIAATAPNTALVEALKRVVLAIDNINVPEGGINGYGALIDAQITCEDALAAHAGQGAKE